MSSKSADNTVYALTRFCGSYRIGCVYSDGAPELDEACRILGYPQNKSRPGVPQNNGIVERCNGDVLAMRLTPSAIVVMPYALTCWYY